MRSLIARFRNRNNLVERVRLAKLEARAAGLHEDNPDVLYLLLSEMRSLRARLEWGLGTATIMAAVGLYHILNSGA